MGTFHLISPPSDFGEAIRSAGGDQVVLLEAHGCVFITRLTVYNENITITTTNID